MSNIQVLSWETKIPFTPADKKYVERTGKLPPTAKQTGLHLGNWGRLKTAEGNVYIAMDVFRYILAIQCGSDVEDYSIDYGDLIEEDVNPYDFMAVYNHAIQAGCDNTREDENVDELMNDEIEDGTEVIDLN